MTNKEFDRILDKEFQEFRQLNKEKLITPSKFANQIGSTQLEDIPYDNQIQIKSQVLKELFNSDVLVIESPKILEYRFKVEFVTSFNPKFEPNNRFGQRKKGNFSWVVDLDEYVLIEQDLFNRAKKVYDFAINLGLQGYDLKFHNGDMRYITVKAYGNQQMLIITANNNDTRFNQVSEFASKQGFNSVYLLINNTLHDSFEGEIVKFIGDEYLTVTVNNKKFLVGPFTFFQNNIFCFEKLINKVEEFIKSKDFKDKHLYDLYCGVGFLGIMFSEYFKSVTGIEIVKESIDLANENIKLNNITNADYKVNDIKLMNFLDNKNSVVIVDPPRNGLEPQGLENLLKINAEYIIYISCNPVTLQKDLQTLCNSYKILDLVAFDMFPQTYHLEGLCILKQMV